jgi:hypothetical protein
MNIRENARPFVEVLSMAFWATLYLFPILVMDRIDFEDMLENASLPISKAVLWFWVFIFVTVHSESRQR